MTEFGRSILWLGIALALIGGGMMLFGWLGVPRLPGDIYMRRGGFTFTFPIVTSILLSLLLTILLNLFLRRR